MQKFQGAIFWMKGIFGSPWIDTIYSWGQNQNLKNWPDTDCFFHPQEKQSSASCVHTLESTTLMDLTSKFFSSKKNPIKHNIQIWIYVDIIQYEC